MTNILKEPITKRMLILVLVSFATLVLVLYIENVFYNNSREWDVKLNNQYASRNLLKAINRNLLEIETEYNGYSALDSVSKFEKSESVINQSIYEIAEILNIYGNGGVFRDTLFLDFQDVKFTIEEISFKAPEDSLTLKIINDLIGKLDEIKFYTKQVVSSLNRKFMFSDEQRTKMLEKAITSIKSQSKPIISDFRDDINFVFLESNNEIKYFEQKKIKSIKTFFFFKFIFLGVAILILFTAFLLIFLQIKKIIIERKEDSELLSENNLMIGNILESVPVGIIVINRQKKVIMINNNALELLEKTKKNDVLGKSWSTIFRISDPKETIGISNIEAELIVNKEKSKAILKSAIPIQLKKEPAIIEAFMDISERHKAEQNLKDAIGNAKLTNRTNDVFYRNMIQNLKAPLKVINDYSQSLQSDNITERQKFYLETIVNNSRYLLEHIDDIHDLSMISKNEMQVNNSTVDVFFFSEKINDIFSNLFIEKNDITLSFLPDENLPVQLYFDEKRVRQIINNILRSILKFAKKGEIKVIISFIESDIKNSAIDLIIKIEESFISIPHSYLRNVFADNRSEGNYLSNSEINSTILELAIAKRIAEVLDGAITISDYMNRGRSYRIVIKNIKKVASQNVKEDITNYDFSSFEFSEAKILIVDSSPLTRILIKNFFSKSKLSFIEIDNGYDAVYTARMRKPDLMIINKDLPGHSGIETAMNIKNEKLIANIPIIGIFEEEDLKNKASYRDVFDSILVKPLDRTKLIDVFLKYLKYSAKPKKLQDASSKKNITKILNPPTDISNVIIQLETTVMQQWKTVKDSHLIDEIEDFGNLVRKMGVENSIGDLQFYGEEIILAVKNFDIPNLSALLNKFNLLIENIKNIVPE